MEVPKRLPAVRLWVQDILDGEFVRKGTEFAPQEFVLQNNQPVGRVAVCGIVVRKEDDVLSVDDGSGIIGCRAFEVPSHVDGLVLGTPVMVVGRPRQFMNTVYVYLEIVKALDVRWLEVWKKTVQQVLVSAGPLPKKEETKSEEVLSLIRACDDAQGADIDRVIRESKVPDCETMVADLLLKGRIFEVSPGRVKVLE